MHENEHILLDSYYIPQKRIILYFLHRHPIRDSLNMGKASLTSSVGEGIWNHLFYFIIIICESMTFWWIIIRKCKDTFNSFQHLFKYNYLKF